jgi:hypothetical protein
MKKRYYKTIKKNNGGGTVNEDRGILPLFCLRGENRALSLVHEDYL